jgi:hypothetical protein
MSNFSATRQPHVTYLPTLTGGIGAGELQQFYADYFLAANPPSTKLTLLSRTIGADRVVDELHLTFKHTQEMPWILPSVPPTSKRVEIALVSIVTLRGGKLCHEHVYWDQASVLVQVGLLDPHLVPESFGGDGLKKLPVVGRTAARRLLRGFEDEDGEADNELIPGWYDDDDDGEENTAKRDENVNGRTYQDDENVNAKDKGKRKAKGIEQPSPNNRDAPKKQDQRQDENGEIDRPATNTTKDNSESENRGPNTVHGEVKEKNEPNNESTGNEGNSQPANQWRKDDGAEQREEDERENRVSDRNEPESPVKATDRDGEDGGDE